MRKRSNGSETGQDQLCLVVAYVNYPTTKEPDYGTYQVPNLIRDRSTIAGVLICSNTQTIILDQARYRMCVSAHIIHRTFDQAIPKAPECDKHVRNGDFQTLCYSKTDYLAASILKEPAVTIPHIAPTIGGFAPPLQIFMRRSQG